MRIAYSLFFILGLALLTACQSTGAEPERTQNQQQFIDKMVNQHGFERAALEKTFSQVIRQPKIIATMNKPAEAKPWYEYRTLFLAPERVQAGANFWQANQKTLEEAEHTYGVPAHIIIGILGVETYYGRITGNHRVMDVLTTLAFDYPKRGTFFRAELEEFLLLSREQAWNPLIIRGSYAGAMGKPQFMPSSYRRYAVGWRNEKRPIDLMTNDNDIIMSIANYLHQKGWKPKQAIASTAPIPKGKLIELQGVDKMESWQSFHNFNVIMKYNPRINYAMAVYQLGEKVRIIRQQDL
ncbi:MAG: lytic murein transglycosylase B [Gammaproteobacteria bacterium]